MSSRKRGIDQADGDDGDGGNKRARNPEGQAVRVQEPMDGVERSNKAGTSLVLHVRALPTFTTQEELLALLTPFGPVTNALITQHNHQAFVQMASLQAAENIVRHSASPPGFHLRGRQIFLQYSNRKEIVAPVSQQGGGGAAASGGMVPQQQQQQPMMMGGGGGGGQFTAPHGSESATPNSVVLLTVSNLRVPVTLDHIHAICKGSGGTVARIVTFMKKEQFKALVQFTDVQGAMQAKQALEGKDIFSGCCHVSVSYSSLPELRITTPSAKARDFLAESTGGPGAVTHASGAVVNPAAAAASMQQQMQQAQQAAMAGYPMDPMNPFAQQMAAAAAAAAASGMNPFAQQMAAAAAAAAGQGQGGAGAQPNPYAHMAGQMGFGFPGAMQFAAGQGGVQNAAASSSGGVGAGAGGSSGGPGCVLLASNLPLNIKPEEIFKLFGVYGDVMRVKILFNRRDSALVQFKDAEGCRSAITHLNQAPLTSGPGAKAMHVSASVHNDISMPKAPAEGDVAGQQQQAEQLTADFSQSKIHRFRNKPAGGKNVFAPSQVLHVGNLPVGTTEEQLQQLFGANSQARLFTQDQRMAYVYLPTLTEAMWALIHLHNHRLNGQFMRVSFSNKDAASFLSGGGGGGGGGAGGSGGQQQQHAAAAQSFSDGQPQAAASAGGDEDAQFADAEADGAGMDGQ